MPTLELVSRTPFLRNFFYWAMPRLLDFSDYKATRKRISSLEAELQFKKIEVLYPDAVHQYFQDLSHILFPPQKLDYSNHLRLSGGELDGGYAISTNPKFCQKWIAVGLGSHIDFEIELANLGHHVYGFDTKIGNFRNIQSNLTLTRKNWSSTDSTEGLTLSTMYLEARIGVKDNWGFKFDIEGNEWDLMGQIQGLQNPPIFVTCELHNFLPNLNNIEILRDKLDVLDMFSQIYFPVFSKGNNYSAHVIYDGISLYDVLEMSWVRRDKIAEFMSSSNIEPQNLYFPNDSTHPLFKIGKILN